jgi:hypothetical protein
MSGVDRLTCEAGDFALLGRVFWAGVSWYIKASTTKIGNKISLDVNFLGIRFTNSVGMVLFSFFAILL